VAGITKTLEFMVPVFDGRQTQHTKKSLKVKIPAGIGDGERIRLKDWVIEAAHKIKCQPKSQHSIYAKLDGMFGISCNVETLHIIQRNGRIVLYDTSPYLH
jgi:hypothetical protein